MKNPTDFDKTVWKPVSNPFLPNLGPLGESPTTSQFECGRTWEVGT